jgi:hypothetical protein
MAEARECIESFNAGARITRLSIYMITGRVAPDDVEAMRAISAEVRDLINAMDAGVRAFDPEQIRDAAKKAREVAAMLSDGAKMRVDTAIESARMAARAITKAVKAGEVAATSIDARILSEGFALARLAFLDTDETGAGFGVLEAPGRSLDLAPDEAATASVGMLAAPSRVLEI